MPRAFIIGNGMSLRYTNLDRIKGEISLAANRIHLIYPDTEWRPTHYFLADYPFISEAELKAELEIHRRAATEMFVWDHWYSDFNRWFQHDAHDEKIHYLDFCPYHQNMDSRSLIRPMAWHFEDTAPGRDGIPQFCKFCGSVNVAFQYAVWKGYNPIILVGCDSDWTPRRAGSEDYNHFHPEYENWRQTPDFTSANARKQDAFYTMKLNLDLATKHGIRVFDATIKGALDFIEKVDFDGITAEL